MYADAWGRGLGLGGQEPALEEVGEAGLGLGGAATEGADASDLARGEEGEEGSVSVAQGGGNFEGGAAGVGDAYNPAGEAIDPRGERGADHLAPGAEVVVGDPLGEGEELGVEQRLGVHDLGEGFRPGERGGGLDGDEVARGDALAERDQDALAGKGLRVQGGRDPIGEPIGNDGRKDNVGEGGRRGVHWGQ